MSATTPFSLRTYHREQEWLSVLDFEIFVFKLFAVDGLPTSTISLGKVTTLDHKSEKQNMLTLLRSCCYGAYCLITRWKLQPLYQSFFPDCPSPFSPVHKAPANLVSRLRVIHASAYARKFSAVLGTMSLYSWKIMRPAGRPPIVMSK